MTSQKFGGDWTAKKLNFFTSYLDAYLIALQNQKFKKISAHHVRATQNGYP